MIEEIRLVSEINPILGGISSVTLEIQLVSTFNKEMLLVSKIFPELEGLSQIDLEEV